MWTSFGNISFDSKQPARNHSSGSFGAEQGDDDDAQLEQKASSFLTNNVYLTDCPCEKHFNKQLVKQTYQLSIEQLFEFLFTKNRHILEFYREQKVSDLETTAWIMHGVTNKRERYVTFNVSFDSKLEKKTILCKEKQMIKTERKNSYYIIDSKMYCNGFRFGEQYFIIRYCLIQIAHNQSSLRITAEVQYRKNVIQLIQSVIEKNALAGLLRLGFSDLGVQHSQSVSNYNEIQQNELAYTLELKTSSDLNSFIFPQDEGL
ncbi:unnamed protein product [Didymodactylos carnosus]|uniref:VASt domain-containing protein n=1 Tax=Didymodactylos carnosus TaxID=1234261 RepID=A0A813WUA6_9BILA|nr:unnamed protein product [Didymodactylos carnosus]CAF3645034.1 unnamed protein product [Didymodactylos carnosus]